MLINAQFPLMTVGSLLSSKYPTCPVPWGFVLVSRDVGGAAVKVHKWLDRVWEKL